MKYSSALLQKFITIQDSPHNVANHLTLKTCEIEDVVETSDEVAEAIPETISPVPDNTITPTPTLTPEIDDEGTVIPKAVPVLEP